MLKERNRFMINTLMKKNWLYVCGGMIAVIAAVLVYLRQPEDKPISIEQLLLEETKSTDIEDEEDEIDEIIVDVKGAVNRPGVYTASNQERVIDVINRAGGLSENADEMLVNFAQKVTDEMVIYIPVIGEEADGYTMQEIAGSQSANDGIININSATESELETLAGIGPSKAASIIEYREANGPFQQIEDIKKISGIGDKTFEKLKDSIKIK